MAIRRTSSLGVMSVGDPKIDAALRAIVTAEQNLEEDASLNTGLVDATITTALTSVRHGLGRPVRTWDIVRKLALGDVYEHVTKHDDPSNYINLVSSATVAVTLRFG